MFGDDFGPWYTPAKAAPMLGLHPKTVRQLCAAKLIEHRETTGPRGRVTYSISRDQIAAYNRRHTVKAS